MFLNVTNVNKMMKLIKRFQAVCVALAVAASGIFPVIGGEKYDEVNEEWQQAIIAAIDSFPENGGYYTGRNSTKDFPRTAWRAMNEAFGMRPSDMAPTLDVKKAQPSFCSSATYLAFLKGLKIWDEGNEENISNLSWFYLKPYCGVTDLINNQGYNQDDGEGFWGMANANGPGMAVLVKENDAGFSFTGYRGAKTEKYRENEDEVYMSDEQWRNDPVWSYARKGDFMKIFWNRNETDNSDSGAIIGVNNNPSDEQEHGHSVIFLGYDDSGNVIYWSSNGPGSNPKEMGYGVATCDKLRIQRVVFTRITKPEKFANIKKSKANKVHKWLSSLAGEHHGTTKELKKYCGIE